MKINKLLGRGEETPDFKAALVIISFILLYSFFSSLFLFFYGKIFPASKNIDLLALAIINAFFVNLLLVIFIFQKFSRYLIPLFKKPTTYFVKGLYAYLAFLPALILITISAYRFFKIAGLAPQLQEIVLLYLDSDSTFLMLLVFFASCIVAPLAEEVIYRGIIYRALKKRFSLSAAIIFSSLIFALFHGEVAGLPSIFFLGVLLAFLFEKYNNLWPSIGLHFFNNFFSNLALLAVKFANLTDIQNTGL